MSYLLVQHVLLQWPLVLCDTSTSEPHPRNEELLFLNYFVKCQFSYGTIVLTAISYKFIHLIHVFQNPCYFLFSNEQHNWQWLMGVRTLTSLRTEITYVWGRWQGDTCIFHDDVIKWKHFPRYWPFGGELTGHRWIPLTKASDAELWCFLWSAPE